MESRSKACFFVGYPKEKIGAVFYSSSHKKVIISTHATYLEKNYINIFKPNSRIIFDELDSAQELIEPQVFFHIVPSFPKHFQREKNVYEDEQVHA